MGAEIIEQGPGNGCLSDSAFIGTDENDCWFGHGGYSSEILTYVASRQQRNADGTLLLAVRG
jgi:hypothetical protein